jgi:hypothetical protein
MNSQTDLSMVVVGASGDLALRKILPAFFVLHTRGLLLGCVEHGAQALRKVDLHRPIGLGQTVQLLTELAPFEQVALVHTHAPEKAQLLRQQASHLFPDGEEPMVAEVTPLIGTPIGPGAAGFVAIQARKQG